MTKAARLFVLIIVALGCAGCDQITKSAAREHLSPGETISLAAGAVRLQYAENPGAFLSVGDSLPTPARRILFNFAGLALVGATVVWALFAKRMTVGQTLGAALICGGGTGNLIDRFCRGGYVTDFLNVGVGPLRTGIFNLADFALLLGLAIVAASGARLSAAAE